MTSDMIKTAVEYLADQLLTKVYKPVEYKQGDNQPVPLRATIGRTLFRVIEDGVTKVVWTDRDFLFRFSDLRKAGILEPAMGDKIIETHSSGFTTLQSTYLVCAPDGEQAYRNGDGRDVIVRVHTKLFDEVTLT